MFTLDSKLQCCPSLLLEPIEHYWELDKRYCCECPTSIGNPDVSLIAPTLNPAVQEKRGNIFYVPVILNLTISSCRRALFFCRYRVLLNKLFDQTGGNRTHFLRT